MAARKILVYSIGNPPPYLNTRHSAGHTLLKLVQKSLSYPPLVQDRDYGGLVSHPSWPDAPYTLFQSSTLMNISGDRLPVTWRAFLRDLPAEDRTRALLVVLHDELQLEPGKVKVKTTGSTGGHRGLSSIQMKLGTKDFNRIGIGIGRPQSHDQARVAEYVLSKFPALDRRKLEDVALPRVLRALKKLSESP